MGSTSAQGACPGDTTSQLHRAADALPPTSEGTVALERCAAMPPADECGDVNVSRSRKKQDGGEGGRGGGGPSKQIVEM